MEENGVIDEDQTAKFEQSISKPPADEIDNTSPVYTTTDPKEETRTSQMSKLREPELEEQIDSNIDKILTILCKVVVSECVTDMASSDIILKPTDPPIEVGERRMITQDIPHTEHILNSDENLTKPLLERDEFVGKMYNINSDHFH